MTFSELDLQLKTLNENEIENKRIKKNCPSLKGFENPTLFDFFLLDEHTIPAGVNIFFSTHPRFSSTASHRHAFIELIYVYSGSCQQIINDQKITMHAGEICILDTNVKHSIVTNAEEDIVINCLMRKSYFDVSFLSRLSGNDLLSSFFVHAIFQSKDYNNYILFPSSTHDNLQHVMKSILCEYFDPGLCSAEMVNSYMIVLFSELLRIYKKTLPIVSSASSNREQITDILVYLQTHYQTADLSSTAAHFNFNASYLSRLIKQTTGKSFIEILHAARLKRVCLLLETTEIPIENLIREVGYANIHYFYQIFKKYEGST
ncbi:MAG: AraC family transcriptional regulator, partial [Vallitaleaceae bacterium]|nr:AraC family transcriptional regulator [Vallitaleaceae bacterium]